MLGVFLGLTFFCFSMGVVFDIGIQQFKRLPPPFEVEVEPGALQTPVRSSIRSNASLRSSSSVSPALFSSAQSSEESAMLVFIEGLSTFLDNKPKFQMACYCSSHSPIDTNYKLSLKLIM